MKNKILTLIIGILIGAIITSIGFIIYIKTNNINNNAKRRMPQHMNQSQGIHQSVPNNGQTQQSTT